MVNGVPVTHHRFRDANICIAFDIWVVIDFNTGGKGENKRTRERTRENERKESMVYTQQMTIDTADHCQLLAYHVIHLR